MLNTLKIAIRSIIRYKWFTIINIIGLAIGFASFFMIIHYLSDEGSYDTFNSKYNRMFRVVSVADYNGIKEESSSCSFPVGPTLAERHPEMVEKMVRFFNFQSNQILLSTDSVKNYEKTFFFCDSTVFDIFDIHLIVGDPKTALNAPYKIIISESASKRYFGQENPLGKTIKYGKHLNLTISGVYIDIPRQSHFRHDFLASLSTITDKLPDTFFKSWIWNPCWTYILLKEGVDINKMNKALEELTQHAGIEKKRENEWFYLQKLENIHIGKSLDYELSTPISITYTRILGGISIFLLLIACINYMHLSTSLDILRAHEIGMKKLLGASRRSLITQYMAETVIISSIALVFAFIILEAFLPVFNTFTGKNLELSYLLQTANTKLIASVLLFVVLLSGAYPSIYFSGMKMINMIKGEIGRGLRGRYIRKGLVILQFTLACLLIAGVKVAYKQIKYMQNAELGFNKENVVILPVANTSFMDLYPQLKSELLANKAIKNVTSMDYLIGNRYNTHEFRPSGMKGDNWQYYPALVVDADFVKTLNIEITEGRDFKNNDSIDRNSSILVNEEMVKFMGLKSNSEAIGRFYETPKGKSKIVGVFKNFHTKSLHHKISPMILMMENDPMFMGVFRNYVAIKVNDKDKEQAISYIKSKWQTLAPEYPFQYFNLADELKSQYKSDEDLYKVTRLFAFVVLIISCIGLLGLSSFMIARRTKEIGVRKVLGATQFQLMMLIYKEFSLTILTSLILFIPITYYLLNKWLMSFAYHTELTISDFLFTIFIIISIAFITISYNAFRVARTKINEVLRYD